MSATIKSNSSLFLMCSLTETCESLNMPGDTHQLCRICTCRYTIVKNGPRRLFVPNSAFLTREFMVRSAASHDTGICCVLSS